MGPTVHGTDGGRPIPKASRTVSPTSFRRLIAVFALVVFALQSYVVQTHVHLLPEIRTGFAIANKNTPSNAQSAPSEKHEHDRHPPSDDPDHCPICQEILYFGSFVMPFLPTLAPPVTIAAPASCIIFVRTIVKVTAHNWFCRGPPHL